MKNNTDYGPEKLVVGRYYPIGEYAFPEKSLLRVRATDEFRPPRRGEWYLSGSPIEGYKAAGDLSTPYRIGQLVKGEIVTYWRPVVDG